VTNPYIRETKN